MSNSKPDILFDPDEIRTLVNFVDRVLNGLEYFDCLEQFAPTDQFDIKLSPEEYLALRETINKL